MTNAEALRRLRQRRRDAGICITCGGVLDDPGKRTCFECRHKPNAKYMKTLRQKRSKKGRCTRCGREPEPGYALCPECREYIADWRLEK